MRSLPLDRFLTFVPMLLALCASMSQPVRAIAKVPVLSAAQVAQIHSLANKLMAERPSVAHDIAMGRLHVDTKSFRTVSGMEEAISAPSLPLRMRGGFSSGSFPAASSLSPRVRRGISALARGGVFGASKVAERLSMGRLRGGRNSRASHCRATATESKQESLPIPSCITDGEEMPPQYKPQEVEEPLYKWWEANGLFKPKEYEEGEKKSYVLPMPPPNVTGGLHMGHAMFVALQDILARYHRMTGKPTLWLPGTDHAGIATQLLFLDRVWEWKNEKGGYITQQLRRLGASADWSRERFTMDEGLSSAVAEAFVRLHEKGLVYRGEYMVNWSPNLRTAVSDLEVEYSEEEGKLYFFKYQLAGEDERYKKYIGKKVKVPFQDREIPVIADTYVDMEFGTGCLKITPGHDPNDYEIGKKHSLPTINIMNLDASLNENAGKYEGMDRFEAREKLWKDMEEAGMTIEVKPHMQRVPRSQRGGEVIEPLISTQWFVKMEGMAKKGIDAVKEGKMKIIPQRYEKVWFNWLENIHDWCVSRQLWWGHRIPVWHVKGTGVYPTTTEYVVARNEEEAMEKAKKKYGDSVELQQDADVLDTWFSSGLWPFSTVGWPDKSQDPASDLSRFYSNRGESCLETGYDILFFWVARMVMLGAELTDQIPFDTVYMHGLVRDAQGKKMSKTTGNVIDPLDVIGQYGTDALRYTLVTGVTPGLDIPLDPKRIESNRNFANKLWNCARFILGNLKDLSEEEKKAMAVRKPMTKEEISGLSLPEQYIVSLCHQLVNDVSKQLDEYVLGQVWIFAAQKSEAADVQAAAMEARRVLLYVLDINLRLLHPFMPYVTEAIWQRAPHEGLSLMTAQWPKDDKNELFIDHAAISKYRALQALVRSIRNARQEYKVEPGKRIQVLISADGQIKEAMSKELSVISTLVKADEESMQIGTPEEIKKMLEEENKKGLSPVHVVVQDGLEAFLPLSGLVDLNKELARLSKQQGTLEKEVDTLESRISAPGFADKAPKAVVDEVNAQLADKREQLHTINSSIDGILAQMPAEEADEWRKAAAAEKAAAEEAARLKAEAAAKKKAEAAAKKAEQAAKKAEAKKQG